ncbi:glycosyltransferase family 2 protein [Defluviitalea phaphyphila]|uniref:glycosyltransferase family 2 protein n=1 Tax=Defluviitalea phaphyphila TaxID=1473580 RepID=UPI00072FD2DF|nr:glycosyltransferase family 2 protein [Defluviitalea phaphyphila]
MKDMVSIIMPTYNNEKFIREAINSVLTQTYDNFELIIIDDASEDNTLNIIHSEYKDSRIKIITLKNNSGAAIARNKGLSISRGRYVAFLDSDDYLNEKCLEYQLKFMKEKKAGFVFGSYELIDENNKKILGKHIVPSKISYYDLLKTCPIKTFTVLIDRKKYTEIKFPIEAIKREDFACWLNLLRNNKIAYGNDKILGYYRINSNSVSRNKIKMMKYQFNVYYNIEKLGLIRSLYYTANWAYFGLKKYNFKI